MRCSALDLSYSGYGQVAAFCEHGNEPSGSMKREEFFVWPTTCYLLRKD
jgi:hypothetical protein